MDRYGQSPVIPWQQRSPPSDYESRYDTPSSSWLGQERRRSPSSDFSRLVTRQRRDREGTYGDADQALRNDYGSRRRSSSPIIIIYGSPPPRSVVDGHRDVASLHTWNRSPHYNAGSLRLHFIQRLRRTLDPSGRDGRSHGAGRNGPVHLHDPGGHTMYMDDIKIYDPQQPFRYLKQPDRRHRHGRSGPVSSRQRRLLGTFP